MCSTFNYEMCSEIVVLKKKEKKSNKQRKTHWNYSNVIHSEYWGLITIGVTTWLYQIATVFI